MRKILIFFIITAAAACGPSKETKALMDRAGTILGKVPAVMPGADSDTPALVALGEKLYNDKRLSSNDTIACASCHELQNRRGGVDNTPTSQGVGGKHGDRNAPTVLNAGFHTAQFWDGRAATLADQAKGPILNPVEMAMPDAATVVRKIKGIEEYVRMFESAYPGQTDPITYDNLAGAIAAFERTLRTSDRFDDFLSGSASALSADEQKGLDLFLNTGCTTCHNGPLFGGRSYQRMGLVHPYENTMDLGRFKVTNNAADRFVFRVPSLRNVAITAPYFHDGRVATLEEAVKKMAYMQLGKELTDEEVRLISAFLRSLTDRTRIPAQ